MKIAEICLVSLVIYCHIVAISGGFTQKLQKLVDDIRGKSADPDERRNATEIIESRGFSYKIYNIPTKDGYILKTYRLINPDVQSGKTPAKRPIILQHGLISQSSYWLMNSPAGFLHDDPEEKSSPVEFAGKGVGKNLGFELSKRGYDIWLPNLRGSILNNPTKAEEEKFKKDHNGKSYWDFSFDEMIDYDLPAVIEHVQKETGHTTVGYVGDSLGGSNLFLLLATYPKYNDILKPGIALAPATNLGHLKMKIPVVEASHLPQILQNPASDHEGNLPGMAVGDAQRLFATTVCATPVLRNLCELTVEGLMGDTDQLNSTRLSVYFSVFPAGASGKTIIHMFQQHKEGDNGVRRYNYGKEKKSPSLQN